MAVSAVSAGQNCTTEPTLKLLDQETLRENNLSMSDLLGVARASQGASATGGMESFTSQITLSHIEVRSVHSC